MPRSNKRPNCDDLMTGAGDMHIRVEGYAGTAGKFLGGWNKLADKIQTFALYRRPSCGKFHFYDRGK